MAREKRRPTAPYTSIRTGKLIYTSDSYRNYVMQMSEDVRELIILLKLIISLIPMSEETS